MIQFSISTQFLAYTLLVIYLNTVFAYTQLNYQTVLFQTIQFSRSIKPNIPSIAI